MSFRKGDMIWRIGPLVTQHVGIYAGWTLIGEAVYHNDKNTGLVRLVSLGEFAAGQRSRS